MSITDKSGCPYVMLAELRNGDMIETDDGFDCLDAGKHQVHSNGVDAWVECRKGQHFLVSSHLDGAVVGFYPVKD